VGGNILGLISAGGLTRTTPHIDGRKGWHVPRVHHHPCPPRAGLPVTPKARNKGMCAECALKLKRVHCPVCIGGLACNEVDVWRRIRTVWKVSGSPGEPPPKPAYDDKLLDEMETGAELDESPEIELEQACRG
jgi:hypothetical protein